MEEFLYKIYQTIGDYFTGSRRRHLFYFLIFIAYFLVIFLQKYLIDFQVSSDTLFWFFSSIAQSLVGLVALMGVMVVFKYQDMSAREERLIEELNKNTSDLAHLGGDLTAISGDDLLENVKRFVPDVPSVNDGWRTIRLRKVKQELESQKFIKGFFNKYMIKFVIYAFSVVLLSLIALSTTQFLSSVSFLAISSLYIVFFLVADILRLVIKGVASTFFS